MTMTCHVFFFHKSALESALKTGHGGENPIPSYIYVAASVDRKCKCQLKLALTFTCTVPKEVG